MSSYAIIGTGAIGGFYGGRLQRAGLEVHFLARSDAEHIRKYGLRIHSPEGDFQLHPVSVFDRAEALPPCQVVVVALKTTQNHLLPEMLPHTLREDGVVLLLQNGLGMEDEVASWIGSDRVMGGLAFICAQKTGPGEIEHLDYGGMALAEYSPDGRPRGITPRLRQIAGDFERAGMEVHLAEDLITARWRKLVWNIPFNGLSVILKATTDRIMSNPEWRARTEAIMREVVADAAACGRMIPESFVDHMMQDTDRMIPYKTSMLIDYENGRPLEIEAIFGNPLRAAQRAGAASPQIELLYEQLLKLK